MTLYTLQFNNYYNRIKKGFDSIESYQPYVVNIFEEVNFNPNDGISTQIILNMESSSVDYLVCVNDMDEIDSRWFIIEAVRTRESQYRLELYRDVIQDWKNEILEAPCRISRGWLNNNDPLIFQPENVTLNQIKVAERLLKDKTDAAWLVGYMATVGEDGSQLPSQTINYGVATPQASITVDNKEEWEYFRFTTQPFQRYVVDHASMWLWTRDVGDVITYEFNRDGFIGGGRGKSNSALEVPRYVSSSEGPTLASLAVAKRLNEVNLGSLFDTAQEAFSIGQLTEMRDRINALDGQFLFESSTGVYYEIEVVTSWGDTGGSSSSTFTDTDVVTVQFNNIVSQINNGEYGAFITPKPSGSGVPCYEINFTPTEYMTINLRQTSSLVGADLTIPATVRSLKDAPYRMFCIPYSNQYKFSYNGVEYTCSQENSLSLASSLLANGGSVFYDIQLLPYCPVKAIRDNGRSTLVLNQFGVNGIDFVVADKAPAFLYFSETSKGSFNIEFSQAGKTPENPISTKCDALTKVSRLCSPNYSGMFEYSATKNNGVSKINVDYHYRPINPYLHLNPDFNVNSIYGKDFDDARGLICGGDFSITRVTNAWTEYELQNKNYNAIFNKQVEKMEYESEYAEIHDLANAISGTVSGSATGAFMGSAGGPWGAVAGGLTGGVLSGIGGYMDYSMNKNLREYSIQHTKDMQDLSLGNIRAIPYSLSKVSSINKNNKIWPFVEVYECTNQEYRALYDNIWYNGMTVGRVGKINDYLPNVPSMLDYGFFQGTLIRLNYVSEDAHVAKVIADELQQGVYL